MPEPTIIDVYSGCGGFALGAELAGFQVTHAVDIDHDLHNSFSLNFPNTSSHLRDIRKIDKKYWDCLNVKRPTGVIGGPPCQGFSNIGRRNIKDKRNQLLGEFFRQVEILDPKFFVMENVKGILSKDAKPLLEQALDRVEKKYMIFKPIVLKASNLGTPTSRERVFIIGINLDDMNPIHMDQLIKAKKKPVTVEDALSDLPRVTQPKKKKVEFDWSLYKYCANECNLDYAKKMKSIPRKDIGWKHAKDLLRTGRVSGNYGTSHSAAVINRFKSTPQGKIESISRYPRLSNTGLCPTLRAGTGSDHGSYQSMRPIHPTNPRVISVREAARLQSFPDWFVFHPTIWHSFRMIGNSVPPLLAKNIMQLIKASL